jgi:hypothetical protein
LIGVIQFIEGYENAFGGGSVLWCVPHYFTVKAFRLRTTGK